MSPWDQPPSEGPSFHAEKNSRAGHSKVKAGLFREITHFTEFGPSQKVRAASRCADD